MAVSAQSVDKRSHWLILFHSAYTTKLFSGRTGCDKSNIWMTIFSVICSKNILL